MSETNTNTDVQNNENNNNEQQNNDTNQQTSTQKNNNVDVEKVNIINVKPKTKRVGRYVGKTKAIRKAIVKIKAGQEIDLFGEKNEK